MSKVTNQASLKRILCRYDSPEWLGEVLMRAVGKATPQSIVDLGSGGGALSIAALARWNPSELYTVDLDKNASEEIIGALSLYKNLSHHHLNIDLMQTLPLNPFASIAGSVDLVVSNPPYRSAQWNPELDLILEQAGFPKPSTLCGDIPTDLIFVAQALNLVRPGGSVGLILPDSMISGKAMTPFRQALVKEHRITRVIQLPRRAFKGTDAQTYVVVLERGKSSLPVRLDRILDNNSWMKSIEISVDSASLRMDHGFHFQNRLLKKNGRKSLRDLGVEVRRGTLSSNELAQSSHPTFHTCNFPPNLGAGVDLQGSELIQEETGVWAGKGDILLARVDRNLERKIAFVAKGQAKLSDCVLRIRCPRQLQQRVLNGLISKDGQGQISARARGTGARHISVSALIEILV